MSRWIFEPGHTAAMFRARHMMVTWVRGLFTDVHGWLDFDPEHAMETVFEGEIEVATIWTGQPDLTRTCAARNFSMSSATPASGFGGGPPNGSAMHTRWLSPI